jgi:hypothetical protein
MSRLVDRIMHQLGYTREDHPVEADAMEKSLAGVDEEALEAIEADEGDTDVAAALVADILHMDPEDRQEWHAALHPEDDEPEGDDEPPAKPKKKGKKDKKSKLPSDKEIDEALGEGDDKDESPEPDDDDETEDGEGDDEPPAKRSEKSVAGLGEEMGLEGVEFLDPDAFKADVLQSVKAMIDARLDKGLKRMEKSLAESYRQGGAAVLSPLAALGGAGGILPMGGDSAAGGGAAMPDSNEIMHTAQRASELRLIPMEKALAFGELARTRNEANWSLVAAEYGDIKQQVQDLAPATPV